jgi:ketosteroid isomerase-like protein
VRDASRMADRWVDAWNRRDLNALLSLYSELVEVHSPYVTLLSSVRGAALRGKAALSSHFEASCAAGPRGRMALEDVQLGEHGVALYVRGGCADRMIMEFELDEVGRITRSTSRLTRDLPTPRSA